MRHEVVPLSRRYVLWGSLGAVAASTSGIPFVTGYGTILCQVVALGGWALLAAVTSDRFADLNDWALWPVVLLVNVFVFSLVALPLYFALRRRSWLLFAGGMVAWLVFYLLALFVLFPATDGP